MRVLGPQAIAQLKADHRKLTRLRPSIGGESADRNFSGNDLRVVIIGTLAAPTNSSVAPTTRICAVLKMDIATKILSPTNKRITIYNYTAGLTAADGTYGLARFLGVWELYWVACGPTSPWTGLKKEPEIEEHEHGGI